MQFKIYKLKIDVFFFVKKHQLCLFKKTKIQLQNGLNL